MVEIDVLRPTPVVPRESVDHGAGRETWTILAVWAALAVAVRVLLGPVVGPGVIGVLGIVGALLFCEWARPMRDRR